MAVNFNCTTKQLYVKNYIYYFHNIHKKNAKWAATSATNLHGSKYKVSLNTEEQVFFSNKQSKAPCRNQHHCEIKTTVFFYSLSGGNLGYFAICDLDQLKGFFLLFFFFYYIFSAILSSRCCSVIWMIYGVGDCCDYILNNSLQVEREKINCCSHCYFYMK